MTYEWDENKRAKNIKSKRLDFIDAIAIFDGRPKVTSPSKYPLEERFVSTAVMQDGNFYSVVWMWRGENRRFISFRRAWDAEERAYRQLHD